MPKNILIYIYICITGSALHFTRVEPNDEGEYSCIAHNSTSGFALTSLPARLTVLCKY